MKKISLVFTMLLTVLMGSLVITSCSSDDEEGEGGSVEDVSSTLVGGWACIYQEREQDNLYQDSYEPSTNMFIQFNADGLGLSVMNCLKYIQVKQTISFLGLSRIRMVSIM